jgi:hypothetical protein
MASIEELVKRRKEAYEYIKYTLDRPPWNIPLGISDEQLADVFGGTIELKDSIRLLREGKHNPTTRLVTAFRELVKGIESDSTIDSYLVDPFK